MNQDAALHPWQMSGKAKWRLGFAFGARYPSVEAAFRGEVLNPDAATALSSQLINALQIPGIADAWAERPKAGNPEGFAEVVHVLLLIIAHLQRSAGMPVFENGRILGLSDAEALVLIPTPDGSYTLIYELLGWLVQACSLIRSGQNPDGHINGVTPLLRQLQSQFGAHSASYQFIAAAHRRGVPFVELPERMLQFGQGHLTHRMRQSFTDVTPVLGVHLSRNKAATARILSDEGIPVPLHQMVGDEKAALKVAEQIGYPVVVKPANLDGGTAVSADLRTPAEVAKAFRTAYGLSNQILVEKHVPGRDYRITVFQNEAIWAVERVPGGVIGDGKTSVRQLVDRLNSDPRRKAAGHSPLKPLHFDEEAHTLLERAGLTGDSVPAAGHFIRLRRAANVASGGMPVPVFDTMHPDNARLAVRAAAAMGLDLAGIDLLIPDISRSWFETGAAICEVNAGPDIGQTTAAHLYEPILSRLVRGTGRIPIVLIVGAPPGSPLDRLVIEGLPQSDIMIGSYGRHGIRVGDEPLAPGPVPCMHGGRILVRDRRVEAILMGVCDDSLLETGLPFPRYDLMIVAGDSITPANPAAPIPVLELIARLLPACDGTVLPIQGVELDVPRLKPLTSADIKAPIAAADIEPFLRMEIARLANAQPPRHDQPFWTD